MYVSLPLLRCAEWLRKGRRSLDISRRCFNTKMPVCGAPTVFEVGEMGEDGAAFCAQRRWLACGPPDSDVRRWAATALQKMGAAGAAFAKEVAVLLTDEDETIRQVGADVLDQMGNASGDLELQAALLSATDDAPASEILVLRAHLRLWSAGDASLQKSVTWLGKPDIDPMPRRGLSPEEARESLDLFSKLWDYTTGRANFRKELSKRIGEVADAISWKLDAETARILNDLGAKLKNEPDAAASLDAVRRASPHISPLDAKPDPWLLAAAG